MKEKYDIEPEYANHKTVLLSNHIGTDEAVMHLIPSALEQLTKHVNMDLNKKCITYASPKLPVPIYKMSCFEVFKCEYMEVKISEAVGMISAETLSPCPPGCIVIDLGEQIQESHLSFFKEGDVITVIKQE